jgi:hypothetical protein
MAAPHSGEVRRSPDDKTKRDLPPGTYRVTKRVVVDEDGSTKFVDEPGGVSVAGLWPGTLTRVEPVPAVSSPSGVPGDGLRERIARATWSVGSSSKNPDRQFALLMESGDMPHAVYADAVLAVVAPLLAERDADRADLRIRRNALARVLGEPATDEPRGGADFYRLVGQVEDLRAELANLRAGIENEARAHLMTRAERDALSLMLRRMARERSEGRREYNSVACALRVKQEFQRGVSAVLAEFGIATGGRLVPDTVDAIREALASRSTPPQDAGAERKLNQAVRLIGDLVDDEDCSLDHHGYCQTHYWFADSECPQARAKRWLDELDKPATPATDPDSLAVHDYCATLAYSTVHVPPGTTDREDTDAEIEPGWWLVGHADGEVVVQVHLGDTLPATDPEPAAGRPGRPDEAVVDNAVAGALTDVYGFVPLDVRYDAAKWARGIVERWLDKPGPVYDLLDDDANESMEEDPDASREEPEPDAPQAPAEPTECKETARNLNSGSEIQGSLSAGPAVPEDTATPTWAAHEVVVVDYGHGSSAYCLGCPDYRASTEKSEVDDWADSHRADTTRPTAPEEA